MLKVAIWLAIMGGPAVPMGTVDTCMSERANLMAAGREAYCLTSFQQCVTSDHGKDCLLTEQDVAKLNEQWSE